MTDLAPPARPDDPSADRTTDPTGDLVVPVVRLDPDLPLPAYAHPGDAGADLVTTVDLVLAPGERALVPTGVALAIPQGYVGLVHPRSGLAARHGLSIVNTPGTVDAGYRGEVKVLLVNLDPREPVELRRPGGPAGAAAGRAGRVRRGRRPARLRQGGRGLRFYRWVRARFVQHSLSAEPPSSPRAPT